MIWRAPRAEAFNPLNQYPRYSYPGEHARHRLIPRIGERNGKEVREKRLQVDAKSVLQSGGSGLSIYRSRTSFWAHDVL